MAEDHIEHLIQLLARLPGLGPRSARRAGLYILKRQEYLLKPLANALLSVSESVVSCSICGNLDSQNPCKICKDCRRDPSKICVVEDISDLWALERSSAFHGRYHVLGGTLSALDGIGPEDLNISNLISRVRTPEVKEVILALSVTVDGQTTAHYISESLEQHEVEVSQLAHGVPIGGELDYLDDGTIGAALKARHKL